MNKQIQDALKMAIEALESFEIVYGDTDLLMPHNFYKTLNACKEALATEQVREDDAQPAQEPVAWMHRHAGEITEFNDFQSCQYCEPLYTHPAPSWQGLSDDEIHNLMIGKNGVYYNFARAIEQALMEKNNA